MKHTMKIRRGLELAVLTVTKDNGTAAKLYLELTS